MAATLMLNTLSPNQARQMSHSCRQIGIHGGGGGMVVQLCYQRVKKTRTRDSSKTLGTRNQKPPDCPVEPVTHRRDIAIFCSRHSKKKI